MFIDDLTLP